MLLKLTEFSFRFNNHKVTIRDNSNYPSIAQHFNLPNPSADNARCALLVSSFTSHDSSRKAESNFVLKRNTHNLGINKDLAIFNDYTFYKNKNRNSCVVVFGIFFSVNSWTRSMFVYMLIYSCMFLFITIFWPGACIHIDISRLYTYQ